MSFRQHLVRWEEEFGKQGLVVVEVSGGEFASFDDSQKRLARNPVGHPVLWDEGNRNHKNYGIKGWPAAYLIGPDGRVFWQGNPAWIRNRAEETQQLRKLLQEQLQALPVEK